MERKNLVPIAAAGLFAVFLWCFYSTRCSSSGCVMCGFIKTRYGAREYDLCRNSMVARCINCRRSRNPGSEVDAEFQECVETYWPGELSLDFDDCNDIENFCFEQLGY